MATQELDFIWLRFEDEIRSDPRTFKQIVAFVGDEGFLGPLEEFIGLEKALMVINVDTDLRLPDEEPKSSIYQYTIEIE